MGPLCAPRILLLTHTQLTPPSWPPTPLAPPQAGTGHHQQGGERGPQARRLGLLRGGLRRPLPVDRPVGAAGACPLLLYAFMYAAGYDAPFRLTNRWARPVPVLCCCTRSCMRRATTPPSGWPTGGCGRCLSSAAVRVQCPPPASCPLQQAFKLPTTSPLTHRHNEVWVPVAW